MIDAIDKGSNGFGALAVERSRQCRDRRYAAICQLLPLAKCVEPGVASDVMNKLNNDCLDNLPAWCLMDDASLQELQRLAGALYYAKALVCCIDGHRLVKWKILIGEELFECTINVKLNCGFDSLPAMPQVLPEAHESLLLANGASILLSTVTDHPAQPLLRIRFAHCISHINPLLALEIHNASLAIFAQRVDTVETRGAQAGQPASSPDERVAP